MLILVDTNLTLRLVEPEHAQHAVAAKAIAALDDSAHQLVIVPQVVYEFWSVATRPRDRNGLGMKVVDAESKLDGLMPTFKLLRDERTIFEIWQQLVIDYEVSGKQVHDARLVAAMLRHGISHLLTFNGAAFTRYAEVAVVEPLRARDLGPAT